MKSVALLFTALYLSSIEVSGYKILGLFPFIHRSHIMMFKSIMEELASRGHTVHVLSHYPRETPLANYTDFSVAGSVAHMTGYVPFKYFDIMMKYDKLDIIDVYWDYSMISAHENVMKSEAVKKLLKSNETYDLIIIEAFATDMVLGFVHKFKAPFIFVSSSYILPITNSIMAISQNPAFVPHTRASRFSAEMTFLERVANTLALATRLIAWYGIYLPASERAMKKYFGEDVPPLLDIYKNASLILSNTHSILSCGRPLAPTVIEVGGVHIRPAKKLPLDIEQFIEESPDGVVYFCLGSLLRTATLPQDKKIAFLHSLSKLKERVLWKFEEEGMALPENVMIRKWMPQRDILAHPKVKLFIAHGGLFGLLEAISEGKPVIGIPIMGEQGTNIRTLELQGAAKFVDYNSIDNETLYEAVQEMLKPHYTKTAKKLSKLFHDRPMSPAATAAYWIEYVIRNNGAGILRSPAIHLSNFQYLLIDVFLFIFFCLLACIFVTYYSFKTLLCTKSKTKSVRTKIKGQ